MAMKEVGGGVDGAAPGRCGSVSVVAARLADGVPEHADARSLLLPLLLQPMQYV